MDGWTDGRTDGRTDGWMAGWVNGWVGGWMVDGGWGSNKSVQLLLLFVG